MAIQRAAPMPLPPEEAARLRSELSKEYGSEVYEGSERRVLVIRVPREDPDPVNDVEAAIEHLQPADVEDISQCLLMGDQRVAQVYVRPLQDLMRERLAFDRAQADHWRQELPGQLSHAVFQAPDDPRRRWRLAVRLPVASVAEVEEEHFDDLVEGIGPLLDTPRFKQLAAVYFIAAQDHLRLQASVFLTEMREKWSSEERARRQAEAERKAADETRLTEAAAKRRAEEERIALLREVDRKMARYQAERAAGTSFADVEGRARSPSLSNAAPSHVPGRPEHQGVLAEAETTLTARTPGPRGPWSVRDVEQPEAAANSAEALLARAAAESADVAAKLIKDVAPKDDVIYDTDAAVASLVDGPKRLVNRLDALRARVDSAIDLSPVRTPVRATEERTQRRSDRFVPRRDSTRTEPARNDPAAPGSSIRGTDPARDIMAGIPRGDAKGRLKARLEACGFDVITAPSTPGHALDIAAERPDGDPQRVVARVVPRLDVATAKQLLKTARELDVDLVLCVAEHVDGEASRILVATKVKLATPADVAAYRF